MQQRAQGFPLPVPPCATQACSRASTGQLRRSAWFRQPRSATFLLRQPRQTQGFREVLLDSPSVKAPFERLISEAESVSHFSLKSLRFQTRLYPSPCSGSPPRSLLDGLAANGA